MKRTGIMRFAWSCALASAAVCADAGEIDPRQYGPSSPMTPVIISEIMYHPLESGTNSGEFVELFNSEPFGQDVSGYRLSGDIDYTFPTGTVIKARSYVAVAKDPVFLQQAYSLSGVFGLYSNSLPNAGGTVRLRNRQNAILLEVEYSDKDPWPAAADGAGHSLVLTKPDYGEADSKAWSASSTVRGNPGTNNVALANALTKVVINEFLAHTDPPLADYVELFNTGTTSVSIAGCYLTDDPAANKHRITNATINARSFLLLDQAQFGFLLAPAGEAIYLTDPTDTYVIDAVTFYGADERGVERAISGWNSRFSDALLAHARRKQ